MENEKITSAVESALKEVDKLRGDEMSEFLDIILLQYLGIDRNKNAKEALEREKQYLHDM